MEDKKTAKTADAEAPAALPDRVFACLDVSGSIRGGTMYPEWVSADIGKLDGVTDWVLWGSKAETRAGLEQVQEYLADRDLTLGGTLPQVFIGHLPASGLIDLHVYTDGQISEHDVEEARRQLSEKHAELRVRQVVVNYVNSNLDTMNVGLSAIFEGHVQETHRTRVADGKKVSFPVTQTFILRGHHYRQTLSHETKISLPKQKQKKERWM